MSIKKGLITATSLLFVLPLLGNATEGGQTVPVGERSSIALSTELPLVIASAMKSIDNGEIELSSSDQKMVAFQLAEAATAATLYGLKE